jgi:Leucine-rich repeat (LRR) protein
MKHHFGFHAILLVLALMSPLAHAVTDCAAVTEIPSTECQVLVAFYNSTNGDSWEDNSGWLETNVPCDWRGVMCSGGHVSELYLFGNQLTGSIPSELGNLTNLERLSLFGNQLTGSIPSELGNLSHLESLSLDNNQLTGSIPNELGNLNNLQVLILSNNRLTGSIPTELSNLNNLWRIELDNNQLTGSIPSQLGNLSNLKKLVLYNNSLTGSIPTELGDLNNLYALYLDGNKLTGSIPSQLGNLTNLSDLWLNDNQLTGSIPTELGNLSNLYRLDLSNNQLTGSIPAELGNLNYLIILNLYNNELCGEIPVELKNGFLYDERVETQLKLDNNHLTASDPEIIKWLDRYNPNWKYTQTSCSTAILRFSSTIYTVTGNSKQATITVTRAGANNGAISANYATTDGTATAGSDYTQTTGTLYWADGDLIDKTITITILDDGKFEGIKIFTISLTSPISGENLDNATIIINNDPPFDCATVTEIPSTECEALNALYNSTGGVDWHQKWNDVTCGGNWWDLEWGEEMTATPCNCNGVRCSGGHVSEIDMNYNRLTGSIPSELGNLSHLSTLNLSQNRLTGSIPRELGNLSNLWALSLSGNQLCGEIPAELKNLFSLSILNLGYNHLTASDPELIAWLDSHNPGWETTQTPCSPQIDLEKDSYNPGELFQARLTEKLTSGYDLYAAVVMPDGNFFALKNTNEIAALNTVAKWDGQRIADIPVMLLDLILPENLPSGEYCLYGILGSVP